jgi:hypothetical protein
MIADTADVAGKAAAGVRIPGLAHPLTAIPTPTEAGPSGPVFSVQSAANAVNAAANAVNAAVNAMNAAVAAGDPARSLPGMDAWSLACRRKTLRGIWRGWLLKSHKPVR